MFCKNCGAKVDLNDNFCSVCGTKVVKKFVSLFGDEDEPDTPIDDSPTDDTPINDKPTDDIPINDLRRFSRVLEVLEPKLYYYDLACTCHEKVPVSGLEYWIMHPIKSFFSQLSATDALLELKRAHQLPTFSNNWANEYTNLVNSLEAEINQIKHENYRLFLLVSPNYWSKNYVDYIIKIAQEGRVHTMAEAYQMLDEQIHRWNMENEMRYQSQILFNQNNRY